MLVNIVLMAIGILVAIAGIMFYVKEKDDPESRKIYMITTIIGIVVAVIFALKIFL